MNREQLYRVQSLRRSKQFLDDHRGQFGVLNSSPAKAALDDAVARLSTLAVEQGTLDQQSRSETGRRWELERELRNHHMASVRDFARAHLRDVPKLAAIAVSTRRLEGERLANAALALADAVEPFAARFTSAQFPADFLEQLRSAAHAVSGSIDARAEKRGRLTGATRELRDALRDGRIALAALGAVVERLARQDPGLLAEWRTARRVVLKPGPPARRAAHLHEVTPADYV